MGVTAQTYYPTTTDQDQSWGTDIRKLHTAEQSPVDNTTWTTHSSTSLTLVTLDPFTSRTTTGDNRDVYGWAINEADMDSTSTAKRTIPAGVWNFQGEVGVNEPALLGSYTFQVKVKVYRVASGTTRTELFTADSSTYTVSLLGGGNKLWTASSASQPEIILEADETLHVGILSNAKASSALLGSVTNTVLKYYVGNQTNSMYVQTPSPGIRTKYILTGYATFNPAKMVGVESQIKKVGKKVTGKMVGVESVSRLLTLHRTYANIMKGVESWNKKITKRITETMVGVPTVSRKLSLKRAFTNVMVGIETIQKKVKKQFTNVMKGVANLTRHSTLYRAISETMKGVASLSRKLYLRRTISEVMVGVESIKKKIGKRFTNTMTGVATMTRKLTLKRAFTNVMKGIETIQKKTAKRISAVTKGVPVFDRKLIIRRTISAVAKIRKQIWIKLRIENLPHTSGVTVIKKIFHIFDD